ncbi:hypothetical protein FIU87_12730 [Bacillus sp. THAF10]|nr:hypothetical protein [Bacillus sp. THAF10]QFT89517.1 hypothetical protein FIU87_12730 [Bacillus sp. THAF10]
MNLKQTAKQLANKYKENPKVEAILLTGSVANGWEDEFSDIELHIFWKTAPTDIDRHLPIQSVNGTVLSFHPFEDDEWSESFITEGGIKLEISNFLTITVENIIDDVCHFFDTNYDKQCILASLHDGLPLYGNYKVEDLKRRILFYPEKLSQAMIKENLFLGNRWNNRRALIKRQDDTWSQTGSFDKTDGSSFWTK